MLTPTFAELADSHLYEYLSGSVRLHLDGYIWAWYIGHGVVVSRLKARLVLFSTARLCIFPSHAFEKLGSYDELLLYIVILVTTGRDATIDG